MIFQEENHNILLLLRISLDSYPINPGILYLLCRVLWSKVTVKLKISSGLRPLMSRKLKKPLWYHNVSRANKHKLFFIRFPYVQPVLFTFDKLCKSSTMTQIYWNEDIVFLIKMISRDQIYSCRIECQFRC